MADIPCTSAAGFSAYRATLTPIGDVWLVERREDVVDWGCKEVTQDDLIILFEGVSPGDDVEPFWALIKMERALR